MPLESSNAIRLNLLLLPLISVIQNTFQVRFHVSFVVVPLNTDLVLESQFECIFYCLYYFYFLLLLDLGKILLHVADDLEDIVFKCKVLLEDLFVVGFDLVDFTLVLDRDRIFFVLRPVGSFVEF